MSKETLIQTINLCKFFGKRKILDNLNLNVQSGDIYGFLGKNGSGKTTTIKMLLGLIHANSGIISLNGYNIKTDFKKAILQVGAIVENPCFYSYLTGKENLNLIVNLYPGLSKNRIEEVLECVELKDRANDKVKTYSLGMKQRLGIAMALVNNPKLVILDEPTNGLDPQGIREIKEIVLKLSKEMGITFFISSHLLNEVEQICTKVGILQDGKLLIEDNINKLLNTDIEVLEICTSDTNKTRSVLESLPYIKSSKISAKGIIVEILKGNSANLNQFLLFEGIVVEHLIPQNNYLEKLFFKITEGGIANDRVS